MIQQLMKNEGYKTQNSKTKNLNKWLNTARTNMYHCQTYEDKRLEVEERRIKKGQQKQNASKRKKQTQYPYWNQKIEEEHANELTRNKKQKQQVNNEIL